jgi:hypothetical protein
LLLDGSQQGVAYEIYINDIATGIISQGTGEPLSFGFVTEQGEYSAKGKVNDCITDMGGKVTVRMISLPAPGISGPSLVCTGEEHPYQVLHNPGNFYDWQVSGGQITTGAGTSNISVQWGQPGSGTVMVIETDLNDCEASSELYEVTIDECTRISEHYRYEITAYPNPAFDHVDLLIPEEISFADAVLMDLLGNELLKMNWILPDQKVQIDLKNIVPGIYILKVKSDDQIFVTRIIRALKE